MGFRQAFDTVKLLAILKVLEESRINHRYSNIIRNIYEKATTTAHFHTNTKKIEIKRGFKQDDIISPTLFTAVLEYAFKMLNWLN